MNRINQLVLCDEWRLAFSMSDKSFYININKARLDLLESYALRDAVRYVGPRRRAMEKQVTRYYSGDGMNLMDIEDWNRRVKE